MLHDLHCYLSLSFVGFPGVKTKKPVGLTGVDTKMVEDFSNRKTSNAKSEILNFATNHTGVLRFLITYCFRVTGLLSLLNFVEYHLYKITQNQF